MAKEDNTEASEPELAPDSKRLAPQSENAALRFPIVGLGASAGGLAAFDAFFSALPRDVDTGMAFVLVQHLAPDHKSLLAELVRRYTRMEVFDVEDGMRVEPNRAYIIPPNCDMGFEGGALRLHAPVAPRGRRLPIDFFFRSLAEAQRERAIGVVFSGTGSDGTLGVRAIKGEGGMAMAQNPESTEFDGMPRSAIATGLVDYVLPPAEMPARLMAYAASSFGKRRASAHPAKAEDQIQAVFELLRTHTGHDFSQYKQNTIRRRVERRMAVHQIAQLSDYVPYLAEAPSEVDALFHDLLIGVTNFFRDPEAFEALDQQVLAHIVADKPNDSAIRVWVAGCSTGEEAYSVAMLLRERLDAARKRCRVQIFATDIDSRAIEAARAGIYPASIAADLTPERLAAHFLLQEDGNCRVSKLIRDLLIFSEQDLTRDPPFSRLDLICCRNLLIYLGPELQKRLIPLFHYALSPAGTLFLGTSETVGEFSSLFSATNRKEKIYQRRQDVHGAARPLLGKMHSPAESGEARAVARKALGREQTFRELPFRELAERALLEESPVGAVIDERGELLYLHGHTGQYLQPAPGEVGVNILKMAREGLRLELTSALHHAISTKERVLRPAVRIKTNGDFSLVDVTVRPVSGRLPALGDQQLFLVTFKPASVPAPASAPLGSAASEGERVADARIVELTRELRSRDDYLQATQEEMQTSNEELKSSNEE